MITRPSDRKRLTRVHFAMRKIDWGGAGQISEALGQDRRSSSLPINRYFFALSSPRCHRPISSIGFGCYMLDQKPLSMSSPDTG